MKSDGKKVYLRQNDGKGCQKVVVFSKKKVLIQGANISLTIKMVHVPCATYPKV
jgi:hypothetical protein